MRKALVIVIVVLAMLAMFVGTVAAAPLAAGTATLVSVEYAGGTPVFIFSVSGEFSNAELKGSVHIEGGEDIDLYCTQLDSSTVRCATSRAAAGKNVVIFWNGQTFWASVPAAKVASASFCYDVYDYDLSYTWQNFGTHCQEQPAQYGDAIPWYNPDWGDNLEHIFMPELACAGLYGDAYYAPFCPL